MPELALISLLQQYHGSFHPVVPFRTGQDQLLAMDLSAANPALPAHALQDLPAFISWVNERLKKAGARYGIGGYAERRSVYSSSSVFDAGGNDNREPRRLHLGVDIWGKPLTPVMAPLDGIVHSFAFNNAYGDYGATIILSHQLEGMTFHTLYGHLSLRSLAGMQEGKRIVNGECFAEFGIPAENGQWPPHLHWQVIQDIGTYRGDYPGVCRESEREYYLANCPDPRLLMGEWILPA